MRHKNEQLAQEILRQSRIIAKKMGMEHLQIRTIAKACHVAPGTVYNYYESKDAILLALAEEFWRDTAKEIDGIPQSVDFCGYLQSLHSFLAGKLEQFKAEFLTGLRTSVNGVQAGKEKEKMMLHFFSLKVAQRLAADSQIPKSVWNEGFTMQQFAEFIVSNLFVSLDAGNISIENILLIVSRVLFLPKCSKQA